MKVQTSITLEGNKRTSYGLIRTGYVEVSYDTGNMRTYQTYQLEDFYKKRSLANYTDEDFALIVKGMASHTAVKTYLQLADEEEFTIVAGRIYNEPCAAVTEFIHTTTSFRNAVVAVNQMLGSYLSIEAGVKMFVEIHHDCFMFDYKQKSWIQKYGINVLTT